MPRLDREVRSPAARCFAALALWATFHDVSWSATLVLANRAPQSVAARIAPLDGGAGQAVSIEPGDVLAVPIRGAARLSFKSAAQAREYLVDPDSAYYFGVGRTGQLDLTHIGLGDPPRVRPRPAASGASSPRIAAPQPVAIPVKILVDEEEVARREVWEERLRQRVAAMSRIVERHCRARFQVVAVDTWKSNNRVTDFHRSLAEFEDRVDPAPARLAIGFTSQYQLPQGRTHLGGVRGPLASHMLLREYSRHASESERLELLTHEAGHFLGAAHSPESDSVMRPILADRKANAKSFRIRFDPVNTLAMNLVTEELRERPLRHLAQLSEPTQARLRGIYTELARTMTDDPAAGVYVQMLERSQWAAWVPPARTVVELIRVSAAVNAQKPERPSGGGKLAGDALADLYFREAAGGAQYLARGSAAQGYLLGLAVALDRGDALRQHALLGPVFRAVENDAQRRMRLAVLGEPTVYGRHDLVQHFTVSAALTALAGPAAAEAAGAAKERLDAGGRSGFSFVDYQADLAGIHLADRLLAGKLSWPTLAEGFTLRSALPPPSELREGLSGSDFAAQYGSLLDSRFLTARRQIVARIEQLPLYKPAK